MAGLRSKIEVKSMNLRHIVHYYHLVFCWEGLHASKIHIFYWEESFWSHFADRCSLSGNWLMNGDFFSLFPICGISRISWKVQSNFLDRFCKVKDLDVNFKGVLFPDKWFINTVNVSTFSWNEEIWRVLHAKYILKFLLFVFDFSFISYFYGSDIAELDWESQWSYKADGSVRKLIMSLFYCQEALVRAECCSFQIEDQWFSIFYLKNYL